MDDLEREIEATIYDFNLNGMPPKRTAKRIMALIASKESVAEVLCSVGLSDAVFTEEYGVLSLRTPEGWLLWHSCKVDGVTLAEMLKEAEENLKKLKETQGR